MGVVFLLPPQEHHQLVFAPARILQAQGQHALGQVRAPGWLAHLARPVRTFFQCGQVVTVESPLPAIERLPANAKVPAGSPHVPPIKGIEQHPLKPLPSRFANSLPEARQLASLGKLIPPNLVHPDTLPSVTNHSERAQESDRPVRDRREPPSARLPSAHLRFCNAKSNIMRP